MSWGRVVRSALRSAKAASDGLDGTRNALFGLWLAIDDAPKNVRDLFRGFSEDDLQRKADDLTAVELFDAPPTAARTTNEKTDLLFWLAVRLRALESLLSLMDDGSPVRDPSDCLATFGGRSAYILPRKPLHRSAKTGDSFRRRGLRRARVIPTRVDEFDVKLVFVDDPRGRDRADRGTEVRSGAGLFEHLSMKPENVPGGFIITDASSPGQLDVIRKQVVEASSADCMSVVYPELAISKQTVSAVCQSLANGTWECSLSMLVMGTHHEPDSQGRFFNVAAILDGYGNLLEPHRKLFRFNDGDGPHEAIEMGTCIPVLVLGQAVVAFGICLDFCNLAEDPPYPNLDVDYVIVPSCGGASTMLGHIRRSGELLAKLKSRTVVVQQFYSDKPKPGDPLGYVMARTSPTDPLLEDVARTLPWTVCTL